MRAASSVETSRLERRRVSAAAHLPKALQRERPPGAPASLGLARRTRLARYLLQQLLDLESEAIGFMATASVGNRLICVHACQVLSYSCTVDTALLARSHPFRGMRRPRGGLPSVQMILVRNRNGTLYFLARKGSMRSKPRKSYPGRAASRAQAGEGLSLCASATRAAADGKSGEGLAIVNLVLPRLRWPSPFAVSRRASLSSREKASKAGVLGLEARVEDRGKPPVPVGRTRPFRKEEISRAESSDRNASGRTASSSSWRYSDIRSMRTAAPGSP